MTRRLVVTLADVAAVVLGIAGIVYVAIELPGVEYIILVILTALGLISVSGVHLAETWTGRRPERHHLLGVASLFSGLGGLAFTSLLRADGVGEAIFHGLGALVLLPFGLLVLFGWLHVGKHP